MAAAEEPNSRVLVLITNDDGIDAPGLLALAQAIERRGFDVVVAAPAANMSGAAAAIGPVDPRVPARRVDLPGVSGSAFAVAAPPAMIVISALNGAFGAKPTAVASGVNAGVNLGRAILHSGTVGAALTGQNLGLPSLAVSVEPGGNWEVAAELGVDVLEQVLAAGVANLANVNVPKSADRSSQCVATHLASFGAVTAAIIGDVLDFQLTLDPEAFDESGTDGAAVRDGQVAVTWLSGFGGAVLSETDLSLERVDLRPE